ncbi:MAG TPA: hypothetical protein VGQ41_10065 [Pyrinomonadaceae bacterium]|jgi:hypothetical protein|nr:hypothetical protein [Pyrinomonadaceae bacterium]
MADKVIVTNVTVLKEKYGAAGMKKIDGALKDLIAADKKRGLATSVVAIDNATAMQKLKAKAVKNAASHRENKEAIDGVYKALAPDYLMILGSIDVIPHQDLKNPLFSDDPEGDDEEFAESDLPYACDAPYSQKIKDFTGPTRVVSRLPDLTGAEGSPDYLLGLLETAATWKSLSRSDYDTYLGISADRWRESTSESLKNIFNNDDDLQTSPKKGFKWSLSLMNRRVHFINCHGGDTLPEFLGQHVTDDDDMPVSHQAAFVGVKGRIREGTVVAAECCFGAQLYDPSAVAKRQMGMCNTYLDKKAYGFFGSSNTAYGPESGNDQADLVCQYFIQRVLAGASLGRAALEARQRFIEKSSPLSPTNRKTLAQFNLFGDPSIVPVEKPTSKLAAPNTKGLPKGLTSMTVSGAPSAKAAQQAGAAERAERRQILRAKGELLSRLQPSMTKSASGPPKKVQTSMKKLMTELNYRPFGSVSYQVKSKPARSMKKGLAKAFAAKQQETTGFHLMFGKTASQSASAKPSPKKKGGKGVAKKVLPTDFQKSRVRRFVVLEAKEVGGKIVAITESHSK